MVQDTRAVRRSRSSAREDLLDAATELLSRRGYTGLRMTDVAARVGVSRQTVYNEFGGKPALAQAVALRTLAEFTDGIQRRLAAADDVLAGMQRPRHTRSTTRRRTAWSGRSPEARRPRICCRC